MAEQTIYKTEKKIDTRTAPKLAADLEALAAEGKFDLVIDMSETGYISSVGLRALLTMQKKVNANGGMMLIRGANQQVREIFDVTGFSGFLTLED
ncbi:MAG: STAS domain-containing protein [Lachnospiraceae bacterium]|jgi:anti-anti-sigma factor|nr:STAS domain-containing protein [Lachnospiraceae bacterium]